MIAYLYRRNRTRKSKRREYRYLEWTSNGTLQLQRLAYQGIKSGKWSGYTDEVPMTESGALLGDLTQSYPECPSSPADKTHDTSIAQVVSAVSADSISEIATGSCTANGAASTLVPAAEESNPIPRAQSRLGDGDAHEDGRDCHHRVASLELMPGSITLGSFTDPVSPVSLLPPQAPAPVPRETAVMVSEVPHQRGTSGSDQPR